MGFLQQDFNAIFVIVNSRYMQSYCVEPPTASAVAGPFGRPQGKLPVS